MIRERKYGSIFDNLLKRVDMPKRKSILSKLANYLRGKADLSENQVENNKDYIAMKDQENVNQEELINNNEEVATEGATNVQSEAENLSESASITDNVSAEIEMLQNKVAEMNDSHLRLMAEYDNYRKRTIREKAELIKSGGEGVLINLLPVVDDFERALANIQNAEDLKAITEGVELIYNKFISFLSQQGVKPIEAKDADFDTELCEAIATIPAPAPEMKGKVIDCVQTGYTLHEKVIRHAKVVVAE